MQKRIAGYIGILAIIGGGVLAYPAATRWWRIQSLPPASGRPVAFEADVRPLLEAHCYECHGEGRKKGGFNLDDRAALLRGGKDGAAVLEGDSAHSTFIHRVAGVSREGRMPPDSKPPLTAEQIGILRAWIDQGVVWEDPA